MYAFDDRFRRFGTGASFLHRAVLAIVVLAAFLLVVSCGDEEPTGPPLAGEIDQSGGTVRDQSGRVQLDFPPGAVSGAVDVTVQPAQSPPADEGLLPGAAFDFGPDGTQFAEPVDLTITYDPAEIPNQAPESSLAIHKAAGDGWVKVDGSQASPESNQVKAPITSFSVFAVISIGGPNEVTTVGDAQAGVVGEPVGVNPAVVVLAKDGTALSGVGVTFRVVEGGGSVTGENQTTDAEGRASVGSWTLGTTPGLNALEADVEGLEAPVRFEANAEAGPPAALAAVEGDGQEARRGTDVDVPPVVEVADAFGNLLEGVEVIWSAGAEGSVTPETTDTDPDGLAGVDAWTLGEPGENALTARVSGADSVVFTATATDPCEEVTSTSIGESVSGEITATDCVSGNGRLLDRYGISFGEQTAFLADVDASGFTPAIFSFIAGGRFIGGHFPPQEYVFAPGEYGIWVGTLATDGSSTGPYTLSLSSVSEPSADCGGTRVTSGVTLSGNITSDDCEDPDDGEPDVLRWFDAYTVRVLPGETVTFTLTADFPHRFTMWRNEGGFLGGQFDIPAGATTTLMHTVPEDEEDFRKTVIGASPISENHRGTGSYTLSVEISGQSNLTTEDRERPSALLIEDVPVSGGGR